MIPIYLASTSVYRRQLLLDAGILVSCLDPCVNESSIVGESPIQTAKMRAEAKAKAGFQQVGEGLVIGADQVVYLDGQVFGKPSSDEAWFSRLCQFRGREHLLTTGVALADSTGVEVFSVTTGVTFRSDLSDAELRAYVRFGEARGCAGGYMMERLGSWLISEIRGDAQNVIGIPVFPLIGRLRARGFQLCPPRERIP